MLAAIVLVAAHLQAVPAFAGPAAAGGDADAIFARVGTREIPRRELEEEVARVAKSRYYHGTPPENLQEEVRREVARILIDRILLLDEATRLGLKADDAAVAAEVAGYAKRYEKSPQWQARAPELTLALTRRLTENDVLGQLEDRVRQVPPPDEAALQAYYAANPDKFTEPAQLRLSVILLKVDPAADKATWDAAQTEAAGLVARLAAGADFAELARVHSGDPSADAGGDLGYLHAGMLGEGIEEAVAKLEPGKVAPPVRVLEGVAILRVEDRKPPRLHALADVRGRAAELWQREASEKAWQTLKDRLRAATTVEILSADLAAQVQQ